MAEHRGDEYIQKLGLEKGHNAVKTIASPFIEVSGDEEIVNVALRNAAAYVKQYGKQYRLMVFILKRNDTGYMMFNDNGGFQVAGPVEADMMKEFAKTRKNYIEAIVGDNTAILETMWSN